LPESQAWFSDELAAIIPPFHSLANQTRLNANDFQGETVHLLGNDESTDSLVKSYFAENGIRAFEFLYAGSIEVIKEIIKLGPGLAFLPTWTTQAEASEGTLLIKPLDASILKRQWSIFYPDRQLNLHEETFIGLCLDAEGIMAQSQILNY